MSEGRTGAGNVLSMLTQAVKVFQKINQFKHCLNPAYAAAHILDPQYDVRESGVWRLPDIYISGSLSAEISVTSPQQLFTFIIWIINLDHGVQQ